MRTQYKIDPTTFTKYWLRHYKKGAKQCSRLVALDVGISPAYVPQYATKLRRMGIRLPKVPKAPQLELTSNQIYELNMMIANHD